MRRIPRHDIHALALTAEWQSEGRGRRDIPFPNGVFTFRMKNDFRCKTKPYKKVRLMLASDQNVSPQ
jgi:hypothetical protein